MYLFLIVFLPILFCILTWAVVTAYRLFFPERILPFDEDPVVLRHDAARAGMPVSVGVREIREDQRHGTRAATQARYHFNGGVSEGLPTDWLHNLELRRN